MSTEIIIFIISLLTTIATAISNYLLEHSDDLSDVQ